MDPNQLNQQPTIPAQPASPPVMPPVITAPKSAGPNKLLLFILIFLFIILIFLGYVFMQQMQKNTETTDTMILPTAAAMPKKPVASPTAELTNESDVKNLDVGSPEADFQDIEKDLQGL